MSFPFDTAKMVALYKEGGFTDEQAKVLTYTLLDVAAALRERSAALQSRGEQVAFDRGHEVEFIQTQRREIAALDRKNKRLMCGSLVVLVVLNIIAWLW